MKKHEKLILSNKQLKLIIQNNQKVVVRQYPVRNVLVLKSIEEAMLQVEINDKNFSISTSECDLVEFSTPNTIVREFKHDFFNIKISYKLESFWVKKEIQVVAKESLRIRFAYTEYSGISIPLTHGGEGQPIFAKNKAFFGAEFPVAQNNYLGNNIMIKQNPYIKLDKTQKFDFAPVVYGIGSMRGIKEDFLEYIKAIRISIQPGHIIFGDWAAHDELSDDVMLDEQMALRLTDSLIEVKSKYDIKFDTYLMDAYWFDDNLPYTKFKKHTWPNGSNQLLKKLDEAKINFGLWFDVSMSCLDLDRGVMRLDNKSYCLADKATANMMFDGMEKQLKECEYTSIKLDFAYFNCENTEHSDNHLTLKSASKEPAVRNFINGINRLRKINPDLLVLAYNGFTTDLKYLAKVPKKSYDGIISPWWLIYLNYLYCGDPRPSEIPTQDLSNSLVYYSDAMVEMYTRSFIPYDSIDDHGTMVGNTGTIYYLRDQGFNDSWIMNISRGSKRLHLYGELDFITHENWTLAKDSMEFFEFVCTDDNKTMPILNYPSSELPYGYSNSNGTQGYVTVVNSKDTPQNVSVTLPEWENTGDIICKEVYVNNVYKENDEHVFNTSLPIAMPANSVQVYKWEFDNSAEQKKGAFWIQPNTRENFYLPEKITNLKIRFFNEDEKPIRSNNSLPSNISIYIDNKKSYPNQKELIWSGVSWAIIDIRESKESFLVTVENNGNEYIKAIWQADMINHIKELSGSDSNESMA